MLKNGFFVRLEAKAGKEQEVENFLRGALPLAQAEPDTIVWFAVKFSPTSFAIFDAFETEEGRQIHLEGKIADALFANAEELLATPPVIDRWDAIVVK